VSIPEASPLMDSSPLFGEDPEVEDDADKTFIPVDVAPVTPVVVAMLSIPLNVVIYCCTYRDYEKTL